MSLSSAERTEGRCLLFVYGTLQRGHAPHERLLARHVVWAQPATTRGVLHLHPEGWPVLVPAAAGGDNSSVAHGELLVLDSADVLSALDAYEDCEPESPETSLYQRVRVPVFVEGEGHASRLAWTYVGQLSGPPSGPMISDGRWRAAD